MDIQFWIIQKCRMSNIINREEDLKMNQDEIDANLLVVTAVEGYAQNHNMTENEVFAEFSKFHILPLIREQYEALHTQPLEETVNFVEDVISRYKGGAK